MDIITSLPEVRTVLDLTATQRLADFSHRKDWFDALSCFAHIAVKNEIDEAEAEDAARAFSEAYPSYDPKVFAEQWASAIAHAQSGKRMTTVGTFIKRLKDKEIDWKSAVITNPFAKAVEQLGKAMENQGGGEADAFPYFKRKGLTGIAPSVALVGPEARVGFHDIKGGEIQAIQALTEEGGKRFVKGSKLEGACWDPQSNYVTPETRWVIVAEGVADALAIAQAFREGDRRTELEDRGMVVLAAGSASNLPKLVSQLREVRVPDPEQDSDSTMPLPVTVACDNDAAGRKVAGKIAAEDGGVRFALPPGESKDFDDARREAGSAAVIEALESAEWRPDLVAPEGEVTPGEGRGVTRGKGRPPNSTYDNTMEGMHTLQSKGICRLSFDTFEDQVFIQWGESEAESLSDNDIILVAVELEKLGLRNVQKDRVRDCIKVVCLKNQEDSLMCAVLDLKPPSRFIDPSELLVRYMGAEDNALNREVGRYILLKALDRALNPGCMSEIVPILISANQGVGKSRFIRALPWEEKWAGTFDYHDKVDDRIRKLRGKWVAEWAETTGLSKRDREYVKADISKQEDAYRPIYEENIKTLKRRHIIIGTANETELFTDPSGARRFAVVKVARFDESSFLRDRMDIWASALQVFKQDGGKCNYAEVEREATKVAGEYQAVDPWEPKIQEYLLRWHPNMNEITCVGIGLNVLKLEIHQIGKRESNRIADILRNLKMESRQKRVNGVRVHAWTPMGKTFHEWQVEQSQQPPGGLGVADLQVSGVTQLHSSLMQKIQGRYAETGRGKK